MKSSRWRVLRQLGVGVWLFVVGAQVELIGGDWPAWRGPEGNGGSRETQLPNDWSLLWKQPYGGRSTPVVHDGRVYVINRAETGVNEQERVMCFDAESGEVLWEHRISVYLTDISSTRIGWASPAVDLETGYVYAQGVENTFLCLDRDGRVVWRRQLHEEYGTINGYGGRTHTPVVDGDLVIISFLNSSWGPLARGSHRYVAFNKRTGSVVWWAQPGGRPLDTTYSTPVVAVINGVRMLIAGNADGGVYAMKVRTGEKVWGFNLSKRGINSSVVVAGGKVYVTHSEDNLDEATMGRLVCIDATGKGDITSTHELWRRDALLAGYASPAIMDGKLYVCDNSANLHCINADTGEQLWEENVGTVSKGSPVVADGKIYLLEVNARFYLVDEAEVEERERLRRKSTSESGLTEKEKKKIAPIEPLQVFESESGDLVENFGSPAIANGRIYFNTRNAMYCLGEKAWTGNSGKVESLAAEKALSSDATHLQVRPADVVLHPGGSVVFSAHSFDSTGQEVGAKLEPSWAIQGVAGEVNGSGRLVVNDSGGFAQGVVKAHAGGLEQIARVRVVPRLPFEVDFSSIVEGKPPAGWVGAGIKFVGATHEGEKVLTKPGKRSRFMDAETFFGLSTWQNYTVQADVLGTKRKRFFPNIGLVNCGYEFVLMGNHQRLRVVSWVPQPRLEQKIKFPWKPNVWYRMKLRVDQKNGVGVIQGKVWPRDEAEPDTWHVEVTDPNPNGPGSPGLHGYSAGARSKKPGAQIFYDNVKVTPNS